MVSNIDIYKRIEKVIISAQNAIEALTDISEEEWDTVYTLIQNRKGKIILTGVGKSGYIAMKVSATLTSLGQQAVFVHPVEAMHGDSGVVCPDDVIIAFSFSGNTKELVLFLRHAMEYMGSIVVGVTGKSDSFLGTKTHAKLLLKISEEGCPLELAPMASTTAMMVIGDAIAAGLTVPEEFTKHDFARFHPSGTLGLSLTPVSERALISHDVSIHRAESIQSVLKRMTEIGKGLIAVVDDTGLLVGSVSDGDVRRFFSERITSEGATAQDFMSTNPKYVTEDETLSNALALMEQHEITNLFVVDVQGCPIGVIHIHDIIAV